MPKIYRTIRTIRRSNSEAQINLAKRRAWFADGDSAGDQQDDKQGDGKYNPATVEDAKKIIAALEKRVGERDATIDQLKASSATQADQIRAIQEANRKKLEEQGDFATVKTELMAQIETLKPSADRAAILEKIIRESNEARMKAVPDQYRAMIPADYPPEKLQTWLNANEVLLSKQPAPNFDAGAGAGGSGGKNDVVKVTDSDKRQAETAQALGHKVTAEDIAKRRSGSTSTASDNKQ